MMKTSLEYFLPHAWYMKRYDYSEFHRKKVATSVFKYHSVLYSHFLFSYFVVVVVCSHSFILFRIPQQYYRQGSIKIGFSVFMFFVDKQRKKRMESVEQLLFWILHVIHTLILKQKWMPYRIAQISI